MLNELSVKDFIAQVASDSPAPGGGSVAALSAAMGAGLISMLANLTIGKAGYEACQDKMKEIARCAKEKAMEFVQTIDTDSQAFDKYMEAMRLPKNTDEEKAARSAAMQQAAKNAATVPLELAKSAFKMLNNAARFCVENGNKNATSDGMVATLMFRAAVLGAIYNVRINLSMIKDEQFKQQLISEIEPMEQAASAIESEILALAQL